MTDGVLTCDAKKEQETSTKIDRKVLGLNFGKSNRF